MYKGPGIVLLITSGHPGSLIFINKVIERGLNVLAIVESDTHLSKKENLTNYMEMVKRLGYEQSFFRFIIGISMLTRMYLSIALSYLGKKQTVLTAGQISKRYRIPYIKTKDINSDSTVAFIRSVEPDLLVSCYFNQILKKEVLELPKIRSVNAHLGLAQKYRGLNSYLWVLAKEETETGVTLHEIDEGIDTGRVIAQRTVDIKDEDTAIGLLIKLSTIGAELFLDSYEKIIEGEFIEIDISESKYFSVLDKNGYEELKKSGRKFINMSDLIHLF